MLSVCCINFSTAASQAARQAGGAHRRALSEKPLFVTVAASAVLYFSHLTRQLSRLFSRLWPIRPRNNSFLAQQKKGVKEMAAPTRCFWRSGCNEIDAR